MIWLAYLILVLLVFAMIYKLYKEDEREYWQQFDETYNPKPDCPYEPKRYK